MRDDIIKDLHDIFQISEHTEIMLKEICGFTIVFKRKMTTMSGNLTQAEIRPVGIIYDENGQYYFAPLYDTVELNEIIKEYVKTLR